MHSYFNRQSNVFSRADASPENIGDDLALELERTTLAFQLREHAIQASANAMVITSAIPPNFLIEYVNPAFERITGYSASEAIGRNCKFLQGDDQDQPGIEEIRLALRENREGNAVLRNYRKDKSLFWNHLYIAPVRDQHGTVSHFVASQYDITPIKNYETVLEHQATHDPLTGLANRKLFLSRLTEGVAAADRFGRSLWVLFVDMDRFKVINDSLGHTIGDLVLKVISERLQTAIRGCDTVARIGGDEFVVILPEQSDGSLRISALQRIMDAVTEAVTLREQDFFLTCSIGVAVYPRDGIDAESLLERADIAMYCAKGKGRNNFQFHTHEMKARVLERLHTEVDLRKAIEREEFELHYQPQVNLHTGLVVGVEALIRWSHPERGMVSPAGFIKLAEETGLITPIGVWVIRTACVQNKAWQNAGLPHLRVGVNLSARQLEQSDFVERVAAVLNETGMDPRHLDIEVTESVIMDNVDHAVSVMHKLKALGVTLSLDDFGTGYSSLSYLRRFPIDALKIDRSFITDIVQNVDDAAIVTSIISLAHNLKLQVIAEGVETFEQLAFLRRNGCDEMQGYYFSKPLPPNDLEKMLKSGTRLSSSQVLLASAPPDSTVCTLTGLD